MCQFFSDIYSHLQHAYMQFDVYMYAYTHICIYIYTILILVFIHTETEAHMTWLRMYLVVFMVVSICYGTTDLYISVYQYVGVMGIPYFMMRTHVRPHAFVGAMVEPS